jgi:MFS family permease
MLARLNFTIGDNSVRRLLAYCTMLLFVFTADGVLSYWAPNFIQESLSRPLLMGLVMASSSVAGLVLDFVFPQLLRGVGLKTLIGMLLVASMGFALTMLASTWLPIVGIFLVAMVIWGLYYELIIFADQQYVASSITRERRSSAWGIISVFKSLAYVSGPIIAGWALAHGDRAVILVSMGLTTVAALLFMFMRFRENPELKLPHQHINLFSEFSHWRVLITHVWPILLLSITMGVVDATFWTTGTVWSEKLAVIHGLGGLFVSAYMLPSLFVGLIVAKIGIYKHKKKIAEYMLLFSNLVLVGIGLSTEIWWQLLVVLVSSTLAGFAYPLVDAVYTDIVARMGRERKHLIGLAGSTFSLAYIVGPVLAGYIAGMVGEQQTFVVIGFGAAAINFALLWITPRKLRLPTVQIKNWKD